MFKKFCSYGFPGIYIIVWYFHIVCLYHPKWSTMKLIDPMILCYNSNFGTPKRLAKPACFNNENLNLFLFPPPKKKISSRERENMTSHQTVILNQIINSKGAGGSPRYPSGYRYPIPLNHPEFNLNLSAPRTSSTSCKPRWLERYSSGEWRNDTHSVKPRCMKRQWDAAWFVRPKRNPKRNVRERGRQIGQWWKYGGVVEVGGGNLESFFFLKYCASGAWSVTFISAQP